jgi:hypothetical protein
MKHKVTIEIQAKDTVTLEQYIHELFEIVNMNLALACKCGGYDYSEKAGEDQIVFNWQCSNEEL